MMKEKLIIIFVILSFWIPLAKADIAEKLTVLSYYPSPYVNVFDLDTQTLLVYDKIQIKPGGYFKVDNTLTINDTGITVNKDSLIQKLIIYNCSSGSCWGRFNISGNLNLRSFGGGVSYIQLGGVPLTRMPQLVNASGQGSLNGPDYDSVPFVAAQDICYRNNPDNYTNLETCLQGVTSSAKASFQTILGPCDDGSGYKCANKKGIRTLTKVGEGVFGIGIAIGQNHVGIGVAAVFGFGSVIQKNYRTFKYELK